MPVRFQSWTRKSTSLIAGVVAILIFTVAPPLLNEPGSHAWAQQGGNAEPQVSAPVLPQTSQPPRAVDPNAVPLPTPEGVNSPPVLQGPKNPAVPDPTAQVMGVVSGQQSGDDAFEGALAVDSLSAPDVNVAGILSGSNPPDTIGDVGPNHYVQMTNPGTYQVFDKTGAQLTGALSFASLWSDGTLCQTNGRGDPVVVYDHLADRWLLMQFAFLSNTANPPQAIPPFWLCFAVSQTPDPTGSYNLYSILTPIGGGTNPGDSFPDYPKIGVWPDAYYMTTHEGSNQRVWALDRSAMLNGVAMQYVSFTQPSLTGTVRETRILPADLDGAQPPVGAAGIFFRSVDDQQDTGNAVDRLEFWTLDVDWSNPGSSALFGPGLVGGAVAAFDTFSCDRTASGLNSAFRDCIPEPGTGTLDALSNRAMMQLKYRNFGTHESMVVNQTIRGEGNIPNTLGIVPVNEVAAVRWYELRTSSAGANDWSIYQQGTYMPQSLNAASEVDLQHRWMGSIAMDKFGNIALGYSLVTDDATGITPIFPSIAYTGRQPGDPLGQMTQNEQMLLAGTVLNGNSVGQRWGDYSAMSVDPSDDCTFWYTSHVANSGNHTTQIGSFRFPGCGLDLEILKSVAAGTGTAGEQLTYTILVTNHGPQDATNVVVIDALPAESTYVTDTLPGCVEAPTGTLTCDLGNIASGSSVTFDIVVDLNSDLGGVINITNGASVDATEVDFNVDNNESFVSTVINELADLSVTKTCKPDRDAVVGEDAPFCEIVISNSGPSMAREVTLNDEITAGGAYTIDNIDSTQGSCSDVGGDVECDLGDIDAGESVTVTVSVLSDLAIDINDIATVATVTPESDYTNNSATGQIHYVLSSADVIVTKQCEPSGLVAPTGSDAFCEIFVFNNGPSTAVNVVLDDQIASDGNYEVTSATPSVGSCPASTGANVDVSCDLGDIAAGDTVSIVVVFTSNDEVDVDDIATATSDTNDPDPNNNTATGSVTFAGADVIVTKQCQPALAPAGTDAICEIFVFNNGPSPAHDVVLDDQIASDGDYEVTSITSTPVGTCSATGANVDVSCDLGTIAAGDTVKVVVVFTSDDAVKVDDIATATSSSTDSDPNNNTATGSVTFTGVADLSITKSDNVDPVTAGTNLTYTLTVANAGPSAAQNVVVTDIVPAGTEIISATATTGNCVIGVAGDPAQPTQCGLGEIASGAPDSVITIVTAVLPDATGVLHNDATVSSDTFDDDNSNNQVTEDTTIIVVTDLALTKTDDQDPVTAGTNLKYVLTLTNGGPSTATDVILVDTLPPQISWVKTKVLGGVGDCLLSATNPDVVTCTLNNMDPGETFTVVITVLVDPSVLDGTTITNNAVVTESSGPGSSASEDTLVNAEADLWIDKTGLFLTENPSKTIRYTLTVHNDSGCSGDDPQVCGDGGPSDALNVEVIDYLPSTKKKLVVTFVSEDCEYFPDTIPHSVICTMDKLAAGDSVFFEIEARPRGRLRAITNTATVSSTTTDPDGGNNSDDMLIIVGGGGQK